MQILDKQLVLSLNKHWIPCGQRTVREAITCLCSETNGETPALALDIEMVKDENGEDVLLYANPVAWDQWIDLPVRENDLFITTSSRQIRAPLVIICRNYAAVPMTRPRLSNGNVWERDQGVCQYTGRKLSRSEGNIDHVTPRDRGGRDSWENLVWCDRKVNSAKGNRMNHEAGLKLIQIGRAHV